MDPESFADLSLRVLAREATAEERRALETELAAQPARREEFERLRLAHSLLRTVAPMTEAARASAPELPSYRLNELRTAVRQHFGPAANRRKTAAGAWNPFLRWIFAGGGLMALATIVIFAGLFNRSVEVGLYGTDTVRSEGGAALSAADMPGGNLVTFDQDAPFDQWQSQPLAWYEHAKIWVDNEHDLLHIVRREKLGLIVTETRPLSPTNEGRRDQIRQAVQELEK